MSKNLIVGVCAFLCLAARGAAAQTWTSVDVGSVGVSGNATLNGSTWTVSGSGADIWGTADAFHFVYRTAPASGSILARVDDLQNTNAFAKAGIMLRNGLDPDAATLIFDVKPDGFLELMERDTSGATMYYRAGGPAMF